MSIKTLTLTAAVLAGTLGFAGEAGAQIVYAPGSYSAGSGVTVTSTYAAPTYSGSYYTPPTYLTSGGSRTPYMTGYPATGVSTPFPYQYLYLPYLAPVAPASSTFSGMRTYGGTSFSPYFGGTMHSFNYQRPSVYNWSPGWSAWGFGPFRPW